MNHVCRTYNIPRYALMFKWPSKEHKNLNILNEVNITERVKHIPNVNTRNIS